MNQKKKRNWWLNVTLFALFLSTFFLKLTGVQLHQWLGMLCGALIAIHLLFHMNWVKRITVQALERLSHRSLLYYALDAALFGGIFSIIATGLLISTWLNIDFLDDNFWFTIHLAISIGTLVLLAVKLLLHWRWIARTMKEIGQRGRSLKNATQQPVAAASIAAISRREFINVAGVVGAASCLACWMVSDDLTPVTADTTTESGNSSNVAGGSGEATVIEPSNPTANETTSLEGETYSLQTENSNSQSESSSLQSESDYLQSDTAVQSEIPCVAQCNRHCAYPGHCRRYRDANNNGYCDLGECA